MTQEEQIALERYNSGEQHNVSTFIDEDTIIDGYGKLDYDFEFPLPVDKIKEIYGTNSWSTYFEINNIHKYKMYSKDTNEYLGEYPLFLDNIKLEEVRKINPTINFVK